MNKVLSHKISNIRVLLCFGVIVIHCNPADIITNGRYALSLNLIKLAVNICNVAVPAFFFISAYLLATRHSYITGSEYRNLIRKRCKSLLLPYCLWNVIALVIRQLIKMSPFGSLTSHQYNFHSIDDFLYHLLIVPEIVPLWFLRNLICFIAFIPLLIWFVRQFKFVACILAIIAECYAPFVGIAYYVFGLYVAICVDSDVFMKLLNKASFLPVIYVLIVVAENFLGKFGFYIPDVVDVLNNLLGAVGILSIVSGKKMNSRFNDQSMIFFLYAFHGVIASYIMKGLNMALSPLSNVKVLLMFLTSFIIIVAVSVCTWLLLKRITPRLVSLLTGARDMPSRSPL